MMAEGRFDNKMGRTAATPRRVSRPDNLVDVSIRRFLRGMLRCGGGWRLFPAVATMVIGLFLDRVANAVEARHYPQNITPRRASIAETARTMLRLMGLMILLNILALAI